ncbi:DNA-binding ferritin-like protein (Dps family) [Actinokineospora baliensis]|nr:hypothetical protein [Actinokineospora baliensis]MBM7770260.1 DNA-binding ferritin-like protein (Dps family) [Actinokineospora baliensis]
MALPPEGVAAGKGVLELIGADVAGLVAAPRTRVEPGSAGN